MCVCEHVLRVVWELSLCVCESACGRVGKSACGDNSCNCGYMFSRSLALKAKRINDGRRFRACVGLEYEGPVGRYSAPLRGAGLSRRMVAVRLSSVTSPKLKWPLSAEMAARGILNYQIYFQEVAEERRGGVYVDAKSLKSCVETDMLKSAILNDRIVRVDVEGDDAQDALTFENVTEEETR